MGEERETEEEAVAKELRELKMQVEVNKRLAKELIECRLEVIEVRLELEKLTGDSSVALKLG